MDTTSDQASKALQHILLLINPQAGGGRATGLASEIEQAIRESSVQLETFSSESPGSIRRWLASSRLEQFDAVIAAGGDGTVFEAVNGLMHHPRTSRPPLGVLPIGTGNAFSRDLGLRPGDWQAAWSLIEKGEHRCFDLGQVDCVGGQHYFLNIAGMGFVVEAGQTARKLKGLGRIAYTLAALWQVLRLHSYRLVMEVDSQRIEQNNLFVEISNSRFTGTTFLMAPNAKLDDGMLDLTLLRKLSRLRLLRLFPTIYTGSHLSYPEVTALQGRHFRIVEPRGYSLMIDGEFVGTTPARISCLPGELSVFC